MLTTTSTRRLLIGTGLAVISLLGAAFGSDADTTSAGSKGTGTGATGAAESSGAIEVTGAWARTSPSSVDTGAAYMTIKGGADDDTLVSVEVPSSIAGTAQIHEMVPAAGGSDSTMAMGGSGDSTDTSGGEEAMVMQEVKGGLEIPAGKTVSLEPGGYHVMLMELAAPLKAGGGFDLTLNFENAGDMTVNVEVRTEAP